MVAQSTKSMHSLVMPVDSGLLIMPLESFFSSSRLHDLHLTLMLGVFHEFLSSADYFQIHFFWKKFLQ